MLSVAVIRHAIAMDREVAAEQGLSEMQRPLTESGCAKMVDAARGLQRILPELAHLITSPLQRAKHTAEIVSEVYGGLPIDEHASLEPDADLDALTELLADYEGTGTVGVVGHEPHLSLWMSWVMAQSDDSFIELKKGGVGLLTFTSKPHAGEAILLWALRPNHLRKLGSGNGH